MNEFIEHIFGGIKPGMFAAAFFFALVGIAISLLISSSKRDPHSPRTPYNFSVTYLLSDNQIRIYKSIVLNLLVLFVCIRFSDDLMGQKLTMVAAFGFGLGIDRLIAYLKARKENAFPTLDKPEA